jgi:cobyrinic acid a,c-diamide synthase
MSPDVCREVLYHGARLSDLAIIEGQFLAACPGSKQRGSSLDVLCEWLDLPRIVIVDVSKLRTCVLPRRPDKADGLLLNRVANFAEACHARTTLEALWGIPVLGHLEDSNSLRLLAAAVANDRRPSRELCRALGDRLASRLQLDRLLQIAEQRPFPAVTPCLFRSQRESAPLNIAVAYDEAFSCYFPDTLDLLELRGATVRDFSPLRCEGLPADTDVVYLGCGPVEQHAEALAGNHCLKQALRNHVRNRGRVYAEGSAVAYMAQQMVLPDGRPLPMVGALPAVASLNNTPTAPQPVEITLAQHTWLAAQSTRLRGYLNSRWQIEPIGPLKSFAQQPGHETDLIGRHQVIGSRLHLNFAAQADLVQNFFQPHAASLLTGVSY